MKIFISYPRSEPTSRLAKKIVTKALGDQAIPLGLAPIARPGIELAEAMRQTARDADYIVVLVGPDGDLSKLQQLEWQAALEAVWADSQKRLILVLIGDGEIPTFVRSTVPPGHAIEFVRIGDPQRDLHKTLKRLGVDWSGDVPWRLVLEAAADTIPGF